MTIAWQVSTVVDGRSFRWGRDHGDDFVAEWSGLLTVHADVHGHMKALVPAPGVDPAYVRKLFRGPATAFARSVVGKLSLHASAFALNEHSLVCIGESGAGKSTLAIETCRLDGVELLADDVAAVDLIDGAWCVSPTEASHWLGVGGDPEDKAEIPARAAAASPARLGAIVALRFVDGTSGPRLQRLRGSEAFGSLLSTPLRFSLTASVWRGELDALVALGMAVPVFELLRSRATPPSEAAAPLVDLLNNPAMWT